MTEASESYQASIHSTGLHSITIQKNRLYSDQRDKPKWNPNVTNLCKQISGEKQSINLEEVVRRRTDRWINRGYRSARAHTHARTHTHTQMSHNDTQMKSVYKAWVITARKFSM